jgi:gas vesicle protein
MIAMRGVGQLYDMQVAAARIMLQTQASAACAFGFPDFSGLFRVADDRARRVFSSGTEQMLHLAEQANEATSEVQRQLGRMLEFHAVTAAENWQHGLEELGVQAEESLEELKELARQQVEETMRAAQAISEETRETMREGGEQFRQTIRQGSEQGRENIAQMGEAGREQAEQAGAAGQEGAREGGEQARGEEAGQERGGQRRKAA